MCACELLFASTNMSLYNFTSTQYFFAATYVFFCRDVLWSAGIKDEKLPLEMMISLVMIMRSARLEFFFWQQLFETFVSPILWWPLSTPSKLQFVKFNCEKVQPSFLNVQPGMFFLKMCIINLNSCLSSGHRWWVGPWVHNQSFYIQAKGQTPRSWTSRKQSPRTRAVGQS